MQKAPEFGGFFTLRTMGILPMAAHGLEARYTFSCAKGVSPMDSLLCYRFSAGGSKQCQLR